MRSYTQGLTPYVTVFPTTIPLTPHPLPSYTHTTEIHIYSKLPFCSSTKKKYALQVLLKTCQSLFLKIYKLTNINILCITGTIAMSTTTLPRSSSAICLLLHTFIARTPLFLSASSFFTFNCSFIFGITTFPTA